jgi:hypothetical protein
MLLLTAFLQFDLYLKESIVPDAGLLADLTVAPVVVFGFLSKRSTGDVPAAADREAGCTGAQT